MARTAHFALHRARLDVTHAEPPASERASLPVMALFPMRAVWMGALVPKRCAKRAVTRNAIKRQIYSVSADFESAFDVAAHLVRLRAGFDRKQFTSATSDLLAPVAIMMESRRRGSLSGRLRSLSVLPHDAATAEADGHHGRV